MTPDELRDMLRQTEGLKLDFKREYKLQKTAPEGVDRQLWVTFMNGQWDELIKDVIALTNGNVGTADKVATLIIGADDKLSEDGSRQLFDTSYLQLTSQQIMARVNSACTPPIADIAFEQVILDGKVISIISILPTPYVHEVSRQLTVVPGIFDQDGRLARLKPAKSYTEYTAFIRKGEDTSPASGNERRALESDKRFEIIALNESIKQELIHNLSHLLVKHDGHTVDTRFFYESFKRIYPLYYDKDIRAKREDLIRIVVPFMAALGGINNIASQFIDHAITSGKYLVYDASLGIYKRGLFLDGLIKLQFSIGRIRHLHDMAFVTNFLTHISKKDRHESVFLLPSDVMTYTYAYLDRYEDIVNLCGALLLYILGDVSKLQDLKLNNVTPIMEQAEMKESETLSDAEVFDWIRNDF